MGLSALSVLPTDSLDLAQRSHTRRSVSSPFLPARNSRSSLTVPFDSRQDPNPAQPTTTRRAETRLAAFWKSLVRGMYDIDHWQLLESWNKCVPRDWWICQKVD